ncbi:PREDICTED: adhesion G-protein coupled receptor G7 [Hipposideros armiger]|uniref:Adhesion G-protein coupled receptor G7 n=1 Tax=Hipposideros armiger TaxID=186990 RepID=A0A8B7RU59_HIPAR|nr:PREDICTED: adhesion G-protein coupled receptor G7 [Hipposideros armiger]
MNKSKRESRFAKAFWRGKSAAPSSTPTGLCSNGGTWQNGRCICPDLWTGLRCTRANFCENSTYGDFTFDKIAVGRYGPSLQKCGVNTVNAGSPRATRLCTLTENGEIELQNATIGNCSANLQTLEDEAKLVAVTTVSQLLDAKEEVFQRAAAATAAANDFATLTTQLGDYSLSMGNQTVVSPNVAIQSVSAPEGSTAFTSVRFTVQKGTSNSLAPGSTRVDPNVDTLSLDAQTELQIHTSKILQSFKKNYKYAESLDILSNVGCALSITGLILTIIFQIVTRKVRKTSVTWVIVSLCTSMLIFNLLFVFGIENKNSKISDSDTNNMDSENNKIPEESIITTPNPTCTVIAALLHYFLLVTFTWTGLSAAQLYFLLLRAMKPLPQRFILFISLIGWVNARSCGFIVYQNDKLFQSKTFTSKLNVNQKVVSSKTDKEMHKENQDVSVEMAFRPQFLCWLAIPESDGIITSPFLWAFIVPVTIILISNIVMFTVICRIIQCIATKKNSSLKKILSTLSIAVVFGITWVLAYAMLLDDDNIRVIFSYIFCLFNTTQGLQIFILYTVKTKVFQAEASKVLKSLSSSAGRVKPLPSMTPLRLRLRMYNMIRSFPTFHERFRLLEPFIVTEETTLSESEETRGVSRQ